MNEHSMIPNNDSPTPLPLEMTGTVIPAQFEASEGPDNDLIEHKLKLTQLGNAERLISRYGHMIRFCPPLKSWLCWDGNRWAQDRTGQILRFATSTVRAIYGEAADSKEAPVRDAIVRHARKSEAKSEIDAMIALARYQKGVPVLPGDCDCDGFVLNCLNGTLDLRTGKLLPHSKTDLLMKLAPVEFDANAKCSLWLGVLHRLLAGNQGLIEFFQRMVGYTLTGAVSEKALFVFVGDGNNGKTTLLEVLRSIMGEYAASIDINVLMRKTNGNDDARERAVAELAGKRFVTSSETQEGQKLNEQLVKQLTGMGIQKGRRIYGSEFEFAPMFKLFIDANHAPEIRGVDSAIWDRIKLIPFNICIPESERDKNLMPKLKAEASGILAWAVEGCLKWQKDGLGTPSLVAQAVGKYREAMDVVADFIADCCTEDAGSSESATCLYNAYRAWAQAQAQEPMTSTAFGRRIGQKGFAEARSSSERRRKGIKLKPIEQPADGVFPEITQKPDTVITQSVTAPVSA